MRPHDWKRDIRIPGDPSVTKERQKILKCRRCDEWKFADDDPIVAMSKEQVDHEKDCDLALVRLVMES